MPTILDEARSLPLEERIDLVEHIWDSIDDEIENLSLSEPQRIELERRIAHYELNPERVISWSDVRANALQRATQ